VGRVHRVAVSAIPGSPSYDPESTPLVALDGHFVPQHAGRGASPVDTFYKPARRDELVWIEAPLSKTGAVRVHTLSRDGTSQSFDALGRNVGDQNQPSAHRVARCARARLVAEALRHGRRRRDHRGVRVMGPVLVEQARSWTAKIVTMPRLPTTKDAPGDPDAATSMNARAVAPGPRSCARDALAGAVKVAALRVIELALDEELDDIVVSLDREHPQSLFAKFVRPRRPSRTSRCSVA